MYAGSGHEGIIYYSVMCCRLIGSLQIGDFGVEWKCMLFERREVGDVVQDAWFEVCVL